MNETKQKILNVLGELGVAKEHILVSGSAIMFLADIPRERPLGDIDLFIPTRVWFRLQRRTGPQGGWEVWTTEADDEKRRCDPPYLFKEMYGVEVNIFFQWRIRHVGDIDVHFWWKNAVQIAGYNCIAPQLLLDWKQTMGRNKDLEDILLLRKHLGIEEPYIGSAD
jgi:hypothetical protein